MAFRMLVGPIVVAISVLAAPPQASADEASGKRPSIPAVCRAAVNARLPRWRLSPPPAELALYAQERGLVTNVASADVDLDGTSDTAVLVVAKRNGYARPHLVVCLNRSAEPRLFVIREPYGQDGIDVRPRGTVGWDHRTGKQVRYWANGIATYAFEKAGGTYLFKYDRFLLIVDSD